MSKLGWTLLFLSPVCVVAQSPDSAAVRGRVTGPNGQVVSGTQVVIEDGQHRVLRNVVAGPAGNFAAEGLAPEAVTVRAEAPGLEADSGPMTLSAGTMATIQLQLHVPSVRTDIVVTGGLGEVRTDEPQLGVLLTSQQAQAMPLLNRRITFLPLVNAANHPAINQGDVFMNQELITANGTGRRQTWFEVDGANGNDLWGRQTIFTNVPLSAIGEMTLLENAFAADYGFGEGAVVNIVTRTGGSRLHGDVLGLWRPSGPEAKLSGFTTTNATSGNDITRDTLDQGAATVSAARWYKLGQTYFLASGEYSYQDRASPVISPLAPGNFIGHYRDWLGFVRAGPYNSTRSSACFCIWARTDFSIPTQTGLWAATRCRAWRACFIARPIRRSWATRRC